MPASIGASDLVKTPASCRLLETRLLLEVLRYSKKITTAVSECVQRVSQVVQPVL